MTNLSNGGENVIAVTFAEDSNAYEALTQLKELDSQGQVHLAAAAVVAREEDGYVETKDEVADSSYVGTVGVGFLGLLVGIVGGPFGVLIGGATGVLIGSLFDIHDADETESALSDISKSVEVGRTSLLAEVTEPSTDVVDTAMKRLGGHVLRHSRDYVEAEIAATEKAQREAKRKARKQLLKSRHHRHMDEIHAKIEELKAKLSRHKKATAAAS